jgi:hypothetical protein
MGDKFIDGKKNQIKNRREKDAEQVNQGVLCGVAPPEEVQNINIRLRPGAKAGIEVGYEVQLVKVASDAIVMYGSFVLADIEDDDKETFLLMVKELPASEAYLTARIIEISSINDSATVQIIEHKGYYGG